MRGTFRAGCMAYCLAIAACAAPIAEREEPVAPTAAAVDPATLPPISAAALPDPWTAAHPGAADAPASSPTTYPDEAGFRERAAAALDGLLTQDPDSFRRGYWARGGGAHLLNHYLIARLIVDPADPAPARYVNEERSLSEHWSEAAVSWSRLLGLFPSAMTDASYATFNEKGFHQPQYTKPRGPEKYHVTAWSSAIVLPPIIPGDRGLGQVGTEAATVAVGKEHLRLYVKRLFVGGQGAWDASPWQALHFYAMLNLYDFADDPEVRLLAKAALDWYATAYALKYTDGVYGGPEQEGFADGPHTSATDQIGYVWFGSSIAPRLTAEQLRHFRPAVAPISSSYRPSAVICNLAHKRLPGLPAEFRNTKPDYWAGFTRDPKLHQNFESFYVAQGFTMGSVWKGLGGKLTRFKLVCASPQGGLVFTAGHPRLSDFDGNKQGVGFGASRGRYTQSAQAGPIFVCYARLPDDEELDYLFVTIPEGAAGPEKLGDWYVAEAGDTLVAIRPLGGEAMIESDALTPKQRQENQRRAAEGKPRKHPPQVQVRVHGRALGLVIHALDATRFDDVDQMLAYLDRGKVAGLDEGDEVVHYTTPEGNRLSVRFAPPDQRKPGNRQATASYDEQPIDFATWTKVYDGPFVTQADGVLSVNDGREGFVIDFTGEMPVYRDWNP